MRKESLSHLKEAAPPVQANSIGVVGDRERGEAKHKEENWKKRN